MNYRVEQAFNRLLECFRAESDGFNDLLLIKKEIEVADEISTAAMKANASRELLEAKIAAMEEANKELAGEYRKSELKFNLLVDAVGGAERAKKLIEAADLDKTAAAVKELAEKHRKEAEGGAP